MGDCREIPYGMIREPREPEGEPREQAGNQVNQLVNQHLQGESGDVPWPPICTAAFWHGLLHDELRKTSMCLAHLQA